MKFYKNPEDLFLSVVRTQLQLHLTFDHLTFEHLHHHSTPLRNIWNPTSFNCLFSACRACDYVYIDYVRRSRSSSCRLLRTINCQTYITLHYISNEACVIPLPEKFYFNDILQNWNRLLVEWRKLGHSLRCCSYQSVASPSLCLCHGSVDILNTFCGVFIC